MSKAPPAHDGKIGNLLDRLLDRLEVLQSAIDTFCAKSDWAAEGWKKQEHIAALFALRTLKIEVDDE